ncbi:hypothetical protein [Oryza sativa Japonica Group]|uniref:Uncharacterized protein n=1 Tax=Oryza sativa subsp. japonica TaxID=39947 RepID=Q8S0N7_ORYSJ|nr:hypothetical protein [Oryza sativa Japonica Group]BAB92334.1 hypothetical protein [Oryza sativa Japonica Group]
MLSAAINIEAGGISRRAANPPPPCGVAGGHRLAAAGRSAAECRARPGLWRSTGGGCRRQARVGGAAGGQSMASGAAALAD